MSDLLPRRGYLGLTLAAASRPAGDFSLPIAAVAPGSSAAGMGILPGDRLTHIDRNPVRDLGEVRTLLRGLRAGDPLLLEVTRGSETLRFEGSVLEFPRERHEGARTELGEVRVKQHLLRAVAVIPDAPGPHPCVYYLPGAHWTSEEYPLELEQPIPALAGSLARAGIAFLRVERSGVGDSQGPPCTELGFDDELAGFRAGLEYLCERDWAEPARVGLFGHSLGAMVAPLLAERARIAGIVTYGASAVPISTALVAALERHAELDLRERATSLARARQIGELIRLVVAGATPEAVFQRSPELRSAAPAHFQGEKAYHRNVRFFHELEQHDLLGAWRKSAPRTLLLHGARDIISSLADSEALARVIGATASVRELPGVDHQMSDAASGARPRLAASVREAVLEFFGGTLGAAL